MTLPGHLPSLVLCALAFLGVPSALVLAAADAVEIGYVEDYDHTTATDVILRPEGEVPLQRLAPVRSGDRFRLGDARAKIVLRISGNPEEVIVSQGNESTPLASQAAEPGFWSGLLDWVGSSINIFDRSERKQITAQIRGGRDSRLVAPMFAVPQVIGAGRRRIAVGWLAPDVIAIGISREGKVIAAGKGIGGLWIGPEVDLSPGQYVISLKGADGDAMQDVTVVDPASLPKLPPDLTRGGIPGNLGETARGVWFAAQGKQYLLEALQHVAADSETFKAASIVVDALIGGMQPLPPP